MLGFMRLNGASSAPSSFFIWFGIERACCKFEESHFRRSLGLNSTNHYTTVVSWLPENLSVGWL